MQGEMRRFIVSAWLEIEVLGEDRLTALATVENLLEGDDIAQVNHVRAFAVTSARELNDVKDTASAAQG
jgi:hypothetical protein